MKHLNRLIVLTVAGAAVAGGAAGCAPTQSPAPAPVSSITAGSPSADAGRPPADPASPTDPVAADPAPTADLSLPEPASEPQPVDSPIEPASNAGAGAAKTDLVGTQYGYLTAVDAGGRTVTFDKVEWFTGAAARKACKADGVRITDSANCNDYYIRNHNPKLRTAALAPGAKVSLQSPNDIMVQLLTTLPKLDAERENRLFILIFKDGRVSRIKEQFVP